jgi:hypothetical protein
MQDSCTSHNSIMAFFWALLFYFAFLFSKMKHLLVDINFKEDEPDSKLKDD